MCVCLSVCLSVTARHIVRPALGVCLFVCFRLSVNRAQFRDDLERILVRPLPSSVKSLSTITSSLRSILVHFQLEARNV